MERTEAEPMGYAEFAGMMGAAYIAALAGACARVAERVRAGLDAEAELNAMGVATRGPGELERMRRAAGLADRARRELLDASRPLSDEAVETAMGAYAAMEEHGWEPPHAALAG